MTDLSPPLQRRSQNTLDAISAATRKLLQTRSFKALTIQDIVNEAKSSTGSFYARFKGKRALLHYLHEELATRSVNELQELFDSGEITMLTKEELAEQLVPELVRSHTEYRGVFRAITIESLDDPQFVKRAQKLVQTLGCLIAGHTVPTAKQKKTHTMNVQVAMGTVLAILDQKLWVPPPETRRANAKEIARLQRIFLASFDP